MTSSVLLLVAATSCASTPTSQLSTRPAYLDAEVVEREIKITKGTWAVSGTLTLPELARTSAAIVLVHGSGPHDRDETIGPNKPFRDLAFGLAAKGTATLCYDKRTHAHPVISSLSSITVENEVIEDALAAVKQLRAQEELRDVPVFVLGHSLGGMLAPEIAERDGHLAGVILMAAPARPWEDMIVEQFMYLLSSGGEKEKAQLSQIEKQAQMLRDRSMPFNQTFLGASRSYWYDLLNRDADIAVGKAAALKCPILILQGGRDYQVTRKDYRVWRSGLKDHEDATFKLFDDVNHLFMPGTGKATAAEYMVENHVDAEVVDTIAEWCLKQNACTKPENQRDAVRQK